MYHRLVRQHQRIGVHVHQGPLLHPQVEEFADKQKELESTIQPIMTRLYQGACSPSDCLQIMSEARLKPQKRSFHSNPQHAEAGLIGFNTVQHDDAMTLLLVQVAVARAAAAACPAMLQVP